MLRQKGVDIKTAQELLRHANSRITLEIYQQAVGDEKTCGSEPSIPGFAWGQGASAPFSTLGGGMKEEVTTINRWF